MYIKHTTSPPPRNSLLPQPGVNLNIYIVPKIVKVLRYLHPQFSLAREKQKELYNYFLQILKHPKVKNFLLSNTKLEKNSHSWFRSPKATMV
jgi:hypothetical protein